MYSVVITKKARKELDALPEQYYDVLRDTINGLAVEPRPIGYKKLTGIKNRYRIRVGMYRIRYFVPCVNINEHRIIGHFIGRSTTP